jgi:hypothetical protein
MMTFERAAVYFGSTIAALAYLQVALRALGVA